jgi:hypothetical protein
MGLGACHVSRRQSNLALQRQFVAYIARLPIFCGGQSYLREVATVLVTVGGF